MGYASHVTWPLTHFIFSSHIMSVITSQLDCLSDVLEDFCTKHNLELMSADDILYGSSDNQLTDYQKDWLSNYISIWDTIANL